MYRSLCRRPLMDFETQPLTKNSSSRVTPYSIRPPFHFIPRPLPIPFSSPCPLNHPSLHTCSSLSRLFLSPLFPSPQPLAIHQYLPPFSLTVTTQQPEEEPMPMPLREQRKTHFLCNITTLTPVLEMEVTVKTEGYSPLWIS